MAKVRVLVVDDSPFIHKAVSRALDEASFEICGIGKNGREGANLYQELKPDVVTMDITMPLVDGLEASKMILQQDPAARIIMMSAMGDEETMEQAKQIGIKTFLQKPFKNDELVAAIQSIYGG